MARHLLHIAIIFQLLGGGYLVASSEDDHGDEEHFDLMAECIDGCDDSCDPGLPCANDCACTCCPGHGFVTAPNCYFLDLGTQDMKRFLQPITPPHTTQLADRIYRPPRTA